MNINNIQYSIRQIHFKDDDTFNPEKLQRIAQHFKVGNSRACQFCLFFIYDLESHHEELHMTENPRTVKKLFLTFKPQQLTKAEAHAASFGTNLGELCKRAIFEVSQLMETNKFEEYHPKVLKFFPVKYKVQNQLDEIYRAQSQHE